MKARANHTQITIVAILAALLAITAVLALYPGRAVADDGLPSTARLTLGAPEDEQAAGDEAPAAGEDPAENLTEDLVGPLAADAGGTWKRLWGRTALDTMSAIVGNGFSKSNHVIVATNAGYWDALSASGLAGVYGCPIVLTDPFSLSSQAASQIRRLGAKNAIIVGGTAAVSSQVEKQIKGLGCKTVRLAGKTAIATSAAIYQHGKGRWGGAAVVTTAGGYWDALSVAPWAYKAKAPVLLVPQGAGSLPSAVFSALKSGPAGKARFSRVVIPGGTAAVSSGAEKQARGLGCSVVRLAGANAYDTSLKVANWCVARGMSARTCGVATGGGYWDALCAGPFCGAKNIPLILAEEGYGACIDGFVAKRTAVRGWLFGGTAALSSNVEKRLKAVSGASTGIPYQKELLDFLFRFYHTEGMYAPEETAWKQREAFADSSRYLRYDSSKVTESSRRGSILAMLAGDTTPSALFFNSGTYPFRSWSRANYEGNSPDPLKKFRNWNYGGVNGYVVGPSPHVRYAYDVRNASEVDWIVRNIFNVSAGDLNILRSKLYTTSRNGYNFGSYYYGGKYYRSASGMTGFGGVDVKVYSWRYKDGFYYLDWGWKEWNFSTQRNDKQVSFHAKFSLKDIGGKTYWSIYTNERVGS